MGGAVTVLLWTVKEVVAHLTLSTRESLGQTIGPLIRARGDFDGLTAARARERACQFTSVELIDQVRDMAGVDRRFALSGRLDPLVDVLVHGQDIVRPLGRQRMMPVHRVVPALDHVWASPVLGVRKRFRGIRFVAADTSWSRGEGTVELVATSGDLLLVVTSRPAGRPQRLARTRCPTPAPHEYFCHDRAGSRPGSASTRIGPAWGAPADSQRPEVRNPAVLAGCGAQGRGRSGGAKR